MRAKIGHVQGFPDRADGDAAWIRKLVRYNPEVARLGVKPIDLVRELRRWPYLVFKASRAVREPQHPAAWRRDNILDRVEGGAVVACREGHRWPPERHVIQASAAGRVEYPLRAVHYAVLEPTRTGRHGHARRRPQFIPSEGLDRLPLGARLSRQLDLGDDNERKLRAARGLQKV